MSPAKRLGLTEKRGVIRHARARGASASKAPMQGGERIGTTVRSSSQRHHRLGTVEIPGTTQLQKQPAHRRTLPNGAGAVSDRATSYPEQSQQQAQPQQLIHQPVKRQAAWQRSAGGYCAAIARLKVVEGTRKSLTVDVVRVVLVVFHEVAHHVAGAMRGLEVRGQKRQHGVHHQSLHAILVGQ